MSKLVIDLDKLTNGTIIDIANDLGCKIKYPKMKIILPHGEDDEELKKKQEEAERENDILFNNYMNNLYCWLEKNNYLKEYGGIEILSKDLDFNNIIIRYGNCVFKVCLNNIYYEFDTVINRKKIKNIECIYLKDYDEWLRDQE